MKFFLTVAVCILKFIYFFFKLLPTQNKILYLSRQSDTISVDFEMIYDKIKNGCNFTPNGKELLGYI